MKRIIKTTRNQRRMLQYHTSSARQFDTAVVLTQQTICEDDPPKEKGILKQMVEETLEKFGNVNFNTFPSSLYESSFFVPLQFSLQDKMEALADYIYRQMDDLYCYLGRFQGIERRTYYIDKKLAYLDANLVTLSSRSCASTGAKLVLQ